MDVTSVPNNAEAVPKTRRPRRWRRIAGILVVVTIVAALAWWKFCPKETPPHVPPDPALGNDARLRKLVVGTWADEYEGKRTMTVRQDGTATMVVELEGIKATLFASRLQFEMVWSIEAGRLKKRTVGGEPEGRVRFILDTMGDRVDEPILELTEERLLLLDADGQTKYDWHRVN